MRGRKCIALLRACALACALVCAALCIFSACQFEEGEAESSVNAQAHTSSTADASAQEESDTLSSEPSAPQPESSVSEETMRTIKLSAGNQTFTATLYDNPAANALLELLPMTLHMSELNGNEKYFYLDGRLPADASKPSGIHAGDLMLYGDNCLVLFYESFSTSYSYTPLGRIDDPEGLASALGSGSVQVTFSRS